MATRIKADPFVIGDLARAESALMELAAVERKISGITLELNEKVDSLKDAANENKKPLESKKKEITDALGTFLKLNRQEVLKDKKSVDLAFGIMGFRASTALVQIRNVNAAMTLERLRQYGLTEGIRLKEELDKDTMRGWPAERLELIGLMRVEKDQFFVELKEEELGKGAA